MLAIAYRYRHDFILLSRYFHTQYRELSLCCIVLYCTVHTAVLLYTLLHTFTVWMIMLLHSCCCCHCCYCYNYCSFHYYNYCYSCYYSTATDRAATSSVILLRAIYIMISFTASTLCIHYIHTMQYTPRSDCCVI
jgi:hypothetical protein